MRYGYMVHMHPPPPRPPRPRTRIFSKHMATLANDARRFLRILHAPHAVRALIAFPFAIGLILAVSRPSHVLPSDAVALKTSGMREGVMSGMSKIAEDMGEMLGAGGVGRSVPAEDFLKIVTRRRGWDVDPENGVSVVAAFKDCVESLTVALASWDAVENVSEIVLVDWGSEKHPRHQVPLLERLIEKGKVSLVRVENAGDWVMARAYNLGMQFVMGPYVIKVDCDTHLEKDFLSAHRKPESGEYYTLGWDKDSNKADERLQGVWFGRKVDFTRINGYDERLVEYGFESQELYRRFHAVQNLQARFLDVTKVWHQTASALPGSSASDESNRTRLVSIRMNEALLKNLPPWPEVYMQGRGNKYSFWYSKKDSALVARITQEAPTVYGARTKEQLERVRGEVMRTALHDDYKVPWDIVSSLQRTDLERLSRYTDSAIHPHIIAVSLEGEDALSNMFNLVSALQLGMSLGRPTVAVWGVREGMEVNQTDGAILEQLFDLEATNKRLELASRTPAAQKLGFKGMTRLIVLKRWPCVEKLSACADKYDAAYGEFSELSTGPRQVFDEANPAPLSVCLHGFLRLSSNTKIGNEETRALVFNALVFSELVKTTRRQFEPKPRVGIVSNSESGVEALVSKVRNAYPQLASSKRYTLPVIGPGQYDLRRAVVNGDNDDGFCVADYCTLTQIAKEVANVLALCNAVGTFPTAKTGDQNSWTTRDDITSMMVADLRTFHLNY